MKGKEVRLSRIMKDGKMLCIPMDHGVTDGPITGLSSIYSTIEKVVKGGASAILVHKGIIRNFKVVPKVGLIMHISASTSLGPYPNLKVAVGSVEEAIRLGADAVSVHINIGCKEEPRMLEILGNIADKCDEWGIPFIAMMYPRGENIKEPTDKKVVAHVARIGAELGADIIKTVYTGDPLSFREVVESVPVPVVIAGGPKANNEREVLEMVYGAMKAGASGVTFGRNIFQHSNPEVMTRAIAKIVFEGSSVDNAMEVLKKNE